METIARFACTRSKLIIILVAILNIAALFSFFRFEIDTDFLGFFASGNPKAAEFDRLKDKYETGETLSVLIGRGDSLVDEENLLEVFQLQQEIENLDGVHRVRSFIPSEIIKNGHVFEVDEKFIDRHHDIVEDFINARYFLTSQFLSSDNSKCILLVQLDLHADERSIIDSLERMRRNEERLTVDLAGNEIIEDTLRDYLFMILLILPPCAIGLVLLVFYLILRNRMLAVASVIPAGIAALWTIGTVLWSGQEISLVTILSPIFVIVMGAADGLHYTSHFMDNMNTYSDRQVLTVQTFRMVGMPIFLTTITTMAGFASLAWAEMVPMRQLGIFVSLGIGYAGALSLFFLPAVLYRVKQYGRPSQSRESRLAKLILAASRHRTSIILLFVGITIISAICVPSLDVESNQLMFFKKDSQIRKTFDMVEEHFGGALPLTAEIIADRGIRALRDYRFAEEVLDVERELERLPGVQSAYSLFDMVQGLNEMMTGSHDYPEGGQIVHKLLTHVENEDLDTWFSDDGLRMIIQTEDLDSLDIGKLEDIVAAHPEIRTVSGMPVLFDEMNRLVVQSQIRSLGLALALVFVMLLVTIRKIRAALVAMLPIIITIGAILSLISVTGFNLNVLTANLAAISVGVGVDYSIHLISGIYYFRKQGLSNKDSVDSALLILSRPILANAFGLAVGLSVLFFSPLHIHTQAASVMWVAMVISSMAALLLIPVFFSGTNARSNKKAL